MQPVTKMALEPQTIAKEAIVLYIYDVKLECYKENKCLISLQRLISSLFSILICLELSKITIVVTFPEIMDAMAVTTPY